MIKCEQLTKRFYRQDALKNISLHIGENKITGIIGRNGAGKTTLLKVVAGFLKPTSGRVSVFEKKPFNHRMISSNLIFVDDEMAFPETLNLGDVLTVAATFYPNWDESFANKLFHHFQLDAKQYHYQLSKGKKSTFNMIVGIAARPLITILDEPITGMDISVRKDFYRVLLKDYLAHPRSMIMSSHHLDEMEGLLEDVILLDEGKVHFHLPIDEMKQYAIGVTGPKSEVTKWIVNQEVLYKEQVGIDDIYVVLRNNVVKGDVRQLGFKVTPVELSDVAMYVTKSERGEIDDVFTK